MYRHTHIYGPCLAVLLVWFCVIHQFIVKSPAGQLRCSTRNYHGTCAMKWSVSPGKVEFLSLLPCFPPCQVELGPNLASFYSYGVSLQILICNSWTCGAVTFGSAPSDFGYSGRSARQSRTVHRVPRLGREVLSAY